MPSSPTECDGGPHCMAAEHLHGCFAVRPRPVVDTTRQDAKALYKTLDELVETLGRVDIEGEIGDVEDYDQAKYDAEIMLQALGGDYSDD